MIFYLKINRCERMMILEKYKTFFCKGVIKKVNTPTVDLCITAIVSFVASNIPNLSHISCYIATGFKTINPFQIIF